jgi:hypothetical protein
MATEPANALRTWLGIVAGATSWILILVWILPPGTAVFPNHPVVKIAIALLLSGIATWSTAPGKLRRGTAGLFFGIVVLKSVTNHGELVGLRELWQRGLVGFVLCSPFLYVLLTSASSVNSELRARRRR